MQPRQGRAQFVRHVVQQTALAVHQGCELRGHAVVVPAQIGQFVAARADRRSDALVEIAARCFVECAAQHADRRREIPGEEGAEHQTGHDRHPERHQGKRSAVAPQRLVATHLRREHEVLRAVGHVHAQWLEFTGRRAAGAESFLRGQGRSGGARSHGIGCESGRAKSGACIVCVFTCPCVRRGRHRAAEKILPLGIDDVDLGKRFGARPAAFERDARRFGGAGERAGDLVDLARNAPLGHRIDPAFGGVREPEHRARAQEGRDLGQPDGQKELPEHSAHGRYSFTS